MKRNSKLNKANAYRISQEVLRNKALNKGVNLVAPETIFLSKDTSFGKNVTVEPYVVIGLKKCCRRSIRKIERGNCIARKYKDWKFRWN